MAWFVNICLDSTTHLYNNIKLFPDLYLSNDIFSYYGIFKLPDKRLVSI